jgi:hypothetical protein
LRGDRLDVRKGGLLRIVDVLQQCAGRGKPAAQIPAVESAEIVGAELRAEETRAAVEIEVPRRAARGSSLPAQRLDRVLLLVEDDLGRTQAFDLSGQCVETRDFRKPKAAGRKVEPGDPVDLAFSENRGDEVVTRFREQRFVGERAGSDDSGDTALDGAFARRDIADLFADGDGLAFLHEPQKVRLHRVIGHAGHRNRVAA